MKKILEGTFWLKYIPFIWLIALVLLPLIILLVISFSYYRVGIPPFDIFLLSKFRIPNFDNLKLLFSDTLYVYAFFSSMKLASISTIICLILGYPVAYFISKLPSYRQIFAIILVIIPMFTSSLVRNYSLITMMKKGGMINKLMLSIGLIKEPIDMLGGQASVLVGMVYSYLPYMILPIILSLKKIHRYLFEAAEDLGCTPFKAFTMVTLPLSMPGIVVGSILVFIPSAGEYIIPDVLGGGNILTFSSVLWNEFFVNQDWPMAAAVSIAAIILILIPLVILQGKTKDEK